MNKLIKAWMALKPRLKSPVVWTGIAAALVAFFGDDALKTLLGRDSDSVMTIVNTVCGVLVAFGILNNPADKEGF